MTSRLNRDPHSNQHATPGDRAGTRGGILTDKRKLDRLITQLRGQVTELRRLEREGGPQEEVVERRRLITRLQDNLANAVRDLLSPPRPPSAHGGV
jgi:hypothetical protein